MEGLGSVFLFAAFQIIVVIIALGVLVSKQKCFPKCVKNPFSPKNAWSSSLTFIHATFFEILASASISMILVPYTEYLTPADMVSIYFSFFFTAVIALYLIFVAYFAIFKSGKVSIAS